MRNGFRREYGTTGRRRQRTMPAARAMRRVTAGPACLTGVPMRFAQMTRRTVKEAPTAGESRAFLSRLRCVFSRETKASPVTLQKRKSAKVSKNAFIGHFRLRSAQIANAGTGRVPRNQGKPNVNSQDNTLRPEMDSRRFWRTLNQTSTRLALADYAASMYAVCEVLDAATRYRQPRRETGAKMA